MQESTSLIFLLSLTHTHTSTFAGIAIVAFLLSDTHTHTHAHTHTHTCAHSHIHIRTRRSRHRCIFLPPSAQGQVNTLCLSHVARGRVRFLVIWDVFWWKLFATSGTVWCSFRRGVIEVLWDCTRRAWCHEIYVGNWGAQNLCECKFDTYEYIM